MGLAVLKTQKSFQANYSMTGFKRRIPFTECIKKPLGEIMDGIGRKKMPVARLCRGVGRAARALEI
jgi:hypothetical protein